MTDEPAAPTPDPTAILQSQLDAANQRLVHAELKGHAIRAGIIDLDCLKLLDRGALALDDDGNLPGGSAAIAGLKRDKPWLFVNPNSSHPAAAPAPEPAKPRSAKDMTPAEWRQARERLIRPR